jgi:hypothetical protein
MYMNLVYGDVYSVSVHCKQKHYCQVVDGSNGVFLTNFPIQTIMFSYNVNTFVIILKTLVKVRQLCSFWYNLDL